MAQAITYTLFDATYRTASGLGVVSEGIATGGSTTTLIDTVNLTQANDYWNGGTVWVLRDSAEGAAAPEGEYGNVTDFVNSTATVTLSAVTTAIASGDRYAIGKKRYPLHQLIRCVNDALSDIGPIEITDTTSLDTVAGQSEYTLPVAASYDLREVWIEVKEDSNDNQWEKINDWYLQATAVGTGTTLIIKNVGQYPTTKDLKLVYVGEHARLDDNSDKISESININRVVNSAIIKALMWRKQRVGLGDPTLDDQIAYFTGLMARDEMKYPIRIPKRGPKLFIRGPKEEEDRFTYPGPA